MFFLGMLSVDESAALSIGLLVRVVTLALAALGGFILLRRGLQGPTARARNLGHKTTSVGGD
ncbi:MAG: hypothetical protein HC915_18770 [Anaerolineae bacterium]|nr:hypothetical protein [Anaerolineae bacterium]